MEIPVVAVFAGSVGEEGMAVGAVEVVVMEGEGEDDGGGDGVVIIGVVLVVNGNVGDVDGDRLVQETTLRRVRTIMQTLIDLHLIVIHPLPMVLIHCP